MRGGRVDRPDAVAGVVRVTADVRVRVGERGADGRRDARPVRAAEAAGEVSEAEDRVPARVEVRVRA